MSHKEIYIELVKMLKNEVKLGALMERLHLSVDRMNHFGDFCVSQAQDDVDLYKVRDLANCVWRMWHG
jgi:hypothetical protein